MNNDHTAGHCYMFFTLRIRMGRLLMFQLALIAAIIIGTIKILNSGNGGPDNYA